MKVVLYGWLALSVATACATKPSREPSSVESLELSSVCNSPEDVLVGRVQAVNDFEQRRKKIYRLDLRPSPNGESKFGKSFNETIIVAFPTAMVKPSEQLSYKLPFSSLVKLKCNLLQPLGQLLGEDGKIADSMLDSGLRNHGYYEYVGTALPPVSLSN